MHLWCNYEFAAAELSLLAFDICLWMIKHFTLSDCLLSPLHSLFTKCLADRLMMSDNLFLSFLLSLPPSDWKSSLSFVFYSFL